MTPDHDTVSTGARVPAASSARFAALVAARRTAIGITQQELAGRAGIGVRTLRELERGRVRKPQRGTVEVLADALRLTGAERGAFLAAGQWGEGDGLSAGWDPEGDGRAVEGWRALLPNVPDLLGRQDLVARVTEELARSQVVALVGLVGVGKTAVALAVAHAGLARFTGGVVCVGVTRGTTADDLLDSVVGLLGLEPQPPTASGATEPTLIVLDGADSADGGAVRAVTVLRAAMPSATILATVRSGQRWRDGVEILIGPLEIPPVKAEGGLAGIRQYPAVALFLRRLRQTRGWSASDAEAPIVAELVRRLGGIPLAIEMAAARCRTMELSDLFEQYGSRVLDLGSASGGRPLHDGLVFGYEMLEPSARRALRWLSVFEGDWSGELATGLLADFGGQRQPDRSEHGRPEPGQPQPAKAGHGARNRLLERLVRSAMVSAVEADGSRYHLPWPVRTFAGEALGSGAEYRRAKARHAAVLTEYAEWAASHLTGTVLITGPVVPVPGRQAADERLGPLVGLPEPFDQLERGLPDLRAAQAHASSTDPQIALRMVVALARLEHLRGSGRPMAAQLRIALNDRRIGPADRGLRGLRAWGHLVAAVLEADPDAPGDLHVAEEAALAVFAASGATDSEIAARSLLAAVWQVMPGCCSSAHRHAEAIRALATRTGRVCQVAAAENSLAWHAVRRGDLAEANRRLGVATRIAAVAGDQWLLVVTRANQAEVARMDRRYTMAVELAQAVLDSAEVPLGLRIRVLGTMGQALAEAGSSAKAETVVSQLAALAAPQGSPQSGLAGAAMARIEAYLALYCGAEPDRRVAASLFDRVCSTPERYDSRQLLESLVGLTACLEPGQRRSAAAERIDLLRAHGEMALLPRDQAVLDLAR